MEKLATALFFAKDAEAAAAFYVKTIPGSHLDSIERIDAPGIGDGKVVVVNCHLAGHPFVMFNGNPGMAPNESFSLTIYAEDQKEVDFLWEALSEGGSIQACGWLKDKWGYSWQIVPKRFVELMKSGSPKVKSQVFGALMQMTKFEIDKLEAAAKG
jgi:predicted 3-demethylubiquinone-9 3-methyltransferase (glyoxalase superfamily)